MQSRQLTYPNGGTVVDRNYTARGQLKDVGWGAGATSYVYWPDGKVHYQARTNQVTTSFEYNGRGMIQSVSHKNASGQNLAFRQYWRDTRDRIVAWKRGTDNTHNAMENGRGDRYGYDPEGQLTVASYRALNPETETPSEAMRMDSFSYDALGNRQGTNNYVASLGAVSFTRRDNGLNQYLNWTPSVIYHDDNHPGPPAWVFPGNGVTMAEGWITASYNALNQPMAMWCSTYGTTFLWFGHDPLGRCVKRWMGTDLGVPVGSNPTTYFYYEGWNLVQEGPNAATSARTYVHGGRVDEIVASEAGGVWRNHHYDARGHCILLTDNGGTIREQYDFDAFGFPYLYTASGSKLPAAQQFGNRFLFTGREWLKDLRIYDYRHRHYQPELGRFLQPDPKQFEAGDYNLYRYCHNDPVNKSDPTGELAHAFVVPVVVVVAGVIVVTPQGREFLSNFGKLGAHLLRELRDSQHSSYDSKLTDISGRPPRTGEPGSTVRGDWQTRRYGDDGYPQTDHDAPHPGKNEPRSRVHDWGRPEGGGEPTDKDRSHPGRDPKPGDPPPPPNAPKDLPPPEP